MCSVTCEYTLTHPYPQMSRKPTFYSKAACRFHYRKGKVIPKTSLRGWQPKQEKTKTEFSFLSCSFRNNTWDLLLKYTNRYLNCLVHLYTKKKFFGQAQAPQNSLWPLQINFCWLGSPEAEVLGLVPLTDDGLLSWLWSVIWLCPRMDF